MRHKRRVQNPDARFNDPWLGRQISACRKIADEAQHIKNRRSQNAVALRALNARTRFLLTGTPLENSLDDLRSLFEFLLPGYLTPVPAGVKGEERSWFNERLLAQTAPYILRRTKKAVAPELPAKLDGASDICLDRSGTNLLVANWRKGTLLAVPAVVPGWEVDTTPLKLETKIDAGQTANGTVMFGFPLSKDAFDKKKSMKVWVKLYDYDPIEMKQ